MIFYLFDIGVGIFNLLISFAYHITGFYLDFLD